METGILKKQKKMSKKSPKPSLGVKFTKREEWLMKETMQKSAEFMAGYGKGALPRQIDPRRYINTEGIEYETFK